MGITKVNFIYGTASFDAKINSIVPERVLACLSLESEFPGDGILTKDMVEIDDCWEFIIISNLEIRGDPKIISAIAYYIEEDTPKDFYELLENMRGMQKDLVCISNDNVRDLSNPYITNIINTLFIKKNYSDDLTIKSLFVSNKYANIDVPDIGDGCNFMCPSLSPGQVKRLFLTQKVFPVQKSKQLNCSCEITFKKRISFVKMLRVLVACAHLYIEIVED